METKLKPKISKPEFWPFFLGGGGGSFAKIWKLIWISTSASALQLLQLQNVTPKSALGAHFQPPKCLRFLPKSWEYS